MAVAFGVSITSSPGEAARHCSGANCGTKSKQEAVPGHAPKKVAAPKKVIKKSANAVARKPGKGRSEYSAEQRAKIMEHARAVCREKFGASSTVYRVDYKKWRVTCVPPGY